MWFGVSGLPIVGLTSHFAVKSEQILFSDGWFGDGYYPVLLEPISKTMKWQLVSHVYSRDFLCISHGFRIWNCVHKKFQLSIQIVSSCCSSNSSYDLDEMRSVHRIVSGIYSIICKASSGKQTHAQTFGRYKFQPSHHVFTYILRNFLEIWLLQKKRTAYSVIRCDLVLALPKKVSFAILQWRANKLYFLRLFVRMVWNTTQLCWREFHKPWNDN